MLMYAVAGALVVLLILLLVFRAQRQKKAGLGAQPKTKGKTAANKQPAKAAKAGRYPEVKKTTKATPAYSTAPRNAYLGAPASVNTSLPTEPLPPAGYTPPAMPPTQPAVPAPRVHSVPIEEILPGSDPLQALVLELLNGWGDLTQEDTNRLGVFRPERVVAAVSAAEIPRELKNSEYARARLMQLKRWAAGLDYSRTGRDQAPGAQQQYSGMAGVAATAAPLAAVPALPVAPMAQPQPAPFFAPVPGATAAPQPAEGWLSTSRLPSQPLPPQPVATPAVPPAAPATPAFTPVAAAPVVDPSSPWADANRGTEAAIAAAAAAFWARPELGNNAPDATPPPAQTPPLAPPIPQVAPQIPSATTQPVEQAPGLLPLGQELPALTVATPEVQAPAVVPIVKTPPREPVSGDVSDTFFEDLSGRVSTAAALLALPDTEQLNLLAFLRPSELAKVLQGTTDAQLKQAVIETLESVGSPAALDIIYRSLDDPDPRIQAKALEAADRLLGAQ